MTKVVIVKPTGTAIAGEVYVGTTQVAIQQAVDFLNTVGGGCVRILAGEYIISSDINLNSNISIIGEGSPTRLIIRGGKVSNVGNVFTCNGTAADPLHDIAIQDMYIGLPTLDYNYNLSAVWCTYVGKSLSTGLSTGDYSRYDSSTVGVKQGDDLQGIVISGIITENIPSTVFGFKYSSNIFIEDCIFMADKYTAVYLDTSNNIFLEDNIVFRVSSFIGSNSSGRCTNIYVNNNLLSNGYISVELLSVSDTDVSGNCIVNTGQYAVRVGTSFDAIIANNAVSNSRDYSIYVFNESEGVKIMGNTVQNGNSNCIYSFQSSDITIASNAVAHNAYRGITAHLKKTAAATTNAELIGNTSSYNATHGLWLMEANQSYVYGNVMTGNATDVHVENSSYVSLVGNIYNGSTFTGTNSNLAYSSTYNQQGVAP